MVAWAAFAEDQFKLLGSAPVTFNSSGSAMRSFCPKCGTGLYYRNAEFLPGIVDIQSATLDDPDALPPVHISRRLNASAGWPARMACRRSSGIRDRN